MAVSERRDDTRWFLAEVYDHEQPQTWSRVVLEEALAPFSLVGFAVVGGGDGREDGVEVRGELGVTR